MLLNCSIQYIEIFFSNHLIFKGTQNQTIHQYNLQWFFINVVIVINKYFLFKNKKLIVSFLDTYGCINIYDLKEKKTFLDILKINFQTKVETVLRVTFKSKWHVSSFQIIMQSLRTGAEGFHQHFKFSTLIIHSIRVRQIISSANIRHLFILHRLQFRTVSNSVTQTTTITASFLICKK